MLLALPIPHLPVASLAAPALLQKKGAEGTVKSPEAFVLFSTELCSVWRGNSCRTPVLSNGVLGLGGGQRSVG